MEPTADFSTEEKSLTISEISDPQIITLDPLVNVIETPILPIQQTIEQVVPIDALPIDLPSPLENNLIKDDHSGFTTGSYFVIVIFISLLIYILRKFRTLEKLAARKKNDDFPGSFESLL